MNNIGDVDKMRDAIWATLYHCSSTDENPEHHKCPAGSKSWCFYQQAITNEKEPPSYATSQGHQLAENVANAMVHVYERMSDTNLLGRIVKGKTQNANESLHSVIWSRCPKTVFVGVCRVCGAVASAIARFNDGTCHISQVMEKLAIERNDIMNIYIEARDNERIYKATIASNSTIKRKRSKKWLESRRQRLALEDEEGVSYSAGGF